MVYGIDWTFYVSGNCLEGLLKNRDQSLIYVFHVGLYPIPLKFY